MHSRIYIITTKEWADSDEWDAYRRSPEDLSESIYTADYVTDSDISKDIEWFAEAYPDIVIKKEDDQLIIDREKFIKKLEEEWQRQFEHLQKAKDMEAIHRRMWEMVMPTDFLYYIITPQTNALALNKVDTILELRTVGDNELVIVNSYDYHF